MAEDTQLIQYIVTHRAKGGEQMDFDKSFWIDAATDMSKQGTPKSPDACQSKWAQICITCHAINNLANVPGLSYTLEHGAGVTTQSEAIWAKFIKNHPQAKPFKTKGWPHYETVHNLISSSDLKNVSPRRKNLFHDILHPTTIDYSNSSDKNYWESMTKALDAVEFGLPMDTSITEPTPSPLLGLNHPARRPRFDPSNISSSESESDNESIYAPSVPVSTSQHASFLRTFEQLGESLKKLNSTLEYTQEILHSVDPIPLRKKSAIIKVQKEDLQDDEILSLINLFQANVTVADSYLAIERDSVRKLYLASCLKK